MRKTYTCASCGGVFEDDWSEEEKMAEMKATFGDLRPDEIKSVCDVCFKAMDPNEHPHLVEECVAAHLKARLTDRGEVT